MARPLLITNRKNATIEELKHVFRVGSNQTATRCTAIQMLLAAANRDLVCNALFVTEVLTTLLARLKTKRANLADNESTLV